MWENYKRFLELIAIISEEWGEAVQALNNYNWKGHKLSLLEKAEEEINQIDSPLQELKDLVKEELKRDFPREK